MLGLGRSGPGKPPEVTDAELACLAVAQVLLRYDDERHWLRAAPARVGHLFPRLLRQSEYNDRLKAAAPLMEAALRWLADHTPGSAEMLRLMDATPVPRGQSAVTARRSGLFGDVGYGYCPSHSRWYWGGKLMLIVTCDGTVTGFALANPKLAGEREAARTMLENQPASRPPPGLRQRVEAIIWTLKNHLGLAPRRPHPRRAVGRIIQRLLALNAAIWHNRQIGAPVKRSLRAYDH